MGRHRHAVAVRTDGLAAVLGPLFADPRIRSAALIDVDSGMVLDVCGPDTAAGRFGSRRAAEHDHRDEVRGAAHAELVRIALALAPGSGGVLGLVIEAGPDRHVLHTVTDPHGGRLALSVVVRGPDRVVAKVRRQLRAVSEAALTAGPSVAVRPGSAGWSVRGSGGPPGAAGGVPSPGDPPSGTAPTGSGPGAPRPAPVPSVPAALPHSRAPGGPPAPASHQPGPEAVEATTPHAALSDPRTRPAGLPRAPLSAMLPSPRPEPPVPAAPGEPADPAPANH